MRNFKIWKLMELVKVGKGASWCLEEFHYSFAQKNDNKQVCKNYRWWLSLLSMTWRVFLESYFKGLIERAQEVTINRIWEVQYSFFLNEYLPPMLRFKVTQDYCCLGSHREMYERGKIIDCTFVDLEETYNERNTLNCGLFCANIDWRLVME